MSETPAAEPQSRAILLGGMAVLVVAAALRLAATTGDLGIDEIWSWWFVKHVIRRFPDLVALRHDNNHLFNTLVMYCLGPDVPGIVYRLPAALASIGSVWLAGRIVKRRGGGSAWIITSLLVGGSYLMILYGSEARGYAYAVFFAFVAWWHLQRATETGRWLDIAGFAAVATFGLLSHLTFVYAYAGFCVWTLWNWRSRNSQRLLMAQLPPLVTAAYLYLFFIGGLLIPPMAIGGGPETTLFAGIVSTLSVAVGGPVSGDGALIAAVAVILLLGYSLIRIAQRDRCLAAAYFTIIVLAPVFVLIGTGHALIYPRYFLVPVGFSLLAIGGELGRWWTAKRTGRIAVVLLLAGYLIANGWWTVRLFDHGRGDYSRALTWIAEQATNGPVSISSDHDFRNGLIYEYYAPRLGLDGTRLWYVPSRFVPPQGTDFVILHNFEGDPPYPETLTDRNGQTLILQRTFRHHSLTGYNWWIYRRER